MLFRPFDLLALKDHLIIWFSNRLGASCS